MIQAQRASYDWGRRQRPDPVAQSRLEARRASNCDQPSLSLLKWDGSRLGCLRRPTRSTGGSNTGLRFAIDPADLGSAKTFNFAVYAAAKVTFDDWGIRA